MMKSKLTRWTLAAALIFLLVGTVAIADGPYCSPIAVVAKVLELAPEQVEALGALLEERQEQIAPLAVEVAALDKELAGLVEAGDDPPRIGVVVLEIQHRRGAIQEIQKRFLATFESILTDEQRHRLAQVRVAAKLRDVVPAFARSHLL